MIKTVLCILIIFCGAVIGLHLSQRMNRRREILLGFEKLFHRALIQIEYNAYDLCGAFAENFASYSFSRELPFDAQWESFVKQYNYQLSKDDLRLLLDFSQDLGAADAESQHKHIKLYGKLLQEHIKSAQEDIGKKSKAVRIIPLSVGIVIALMMI